MIHFTVTTRRALEHAEHEALRFNHEYVGTEHVLLSLRWVHSGRANDLLSRFGVDLRTLRIRVEELALSGKSESPSLPIPFTPRAKRAILQARSTATKLGLDVLDSEHILLGLLSDPQCRAWQVLSSLGIDTTALRQQASAQSGGPACFS